MATRQREALDSYKVLTEWTQEVTNWIILGDLNETRDEKLDRSSPTTQQKGTCRRGKFVEKFISSTGAIDMWREANTPNGHTRKDPVSRATARLVIISPGLLPGTGKSKCG